MKIVITTNNVTTEERGEVLKKIQKDIKNGFNRRENGKVLKGTYNFETILSFHEARVLVKKEKKEAR